MHELLLRENCKSYQSSSYQLYIKTYAIAQRHCFIVKSQQAYFSGKGGFDSGCYLFFQEYKNNKNTHPSKKDLLLPKAISSHELRCKIKMDSD